MQDRVPDTRTKQKGGLDLGLPRVVYQGKGPPIDTPDSLYLSLSGWIGLDLGVGLGAASGRSSGLKEGTCILKKPTLRV